MMVVARLVLTQAAAEVNSHRICSECGERFQRARLRNCTRQWFTSKAVGPGTFRFWCEVAGIDWQSLRRRIMDRIQEADRGNA